MSNKVLSTYEREMKDPEFKKEYRKHYTRLVLSELIIALMEKDHKSVRVLAAECDISTTIITKLRSGKQKDLKLSNFLNLIEFFGYDLILEKGNERIPVSQDLEEAPTAKKKTATHRRLAVTKQKAQHARRAAG